ncbi:hypothetical protein D5R40_30855 [Okeania hirsuta]|uniref:Uncharacterized protein n=1 Tax=Okeania hirsuta TaxID=1458930 RepID=A0A3N6NWJ0_9CYAN|nr:hypothetical protein D5R40_30855 [Okeania hirsuta]
MADAVGVYHANPKLSLSLSRINWGIYNDDTGMPCISSKNVPPTTGVMSQALAVPNIMSYSKCWIMCWASMDTMWIKHLPCGRTLDLFLGDWDRHDDQWRWAQFEDDEGEKYSARYLGIEIRYLPL